MNIKKITNVIKIIIIFFYFKEPVVLAQNFYSADPYFLLINESLSFKNKKYLNSNIFRPYFKNTDSLVFDLRILKQIFLNDNSPNQENMDLRYFSKGISAFSSIRFSLSSSYLSLIFEPYLLQNNLFNTSSPGRYGPFSVLNDMPLENILKSYNSKNIRNLLIFAHYKGIGMGIHKGNRWWGPGIHTSLQMTTNTFPLPAQIIGTLKEKRVGAFGIFALYSFSRLNNKKNSEAKYLTSLNGKLSWHGPLIFSIGFSRNYLTGGENISNYSWKESDAQKIVFEGLLTSNLLEKEYTVGGHDLWDQTLSTYFSIILPNRNLKIYAEVGFNDNRMYFADLLSQPDHSMATIIGIRDYGLGKMKNYIWGFEWTNLMITYTSKFRPTGPGTWYNRSQYYYSSYYNRRWAAHSGTDSDDWLLFFGYISDKVIIIPSINYERHGIVSHRPAEVKTELKFDFRYKLKNTWFGIVYEKQFEAFLGFPDYFYVDQFNNSIDSSSGKLAGSRFTNTLILTLYKDIIF